MKKIKKKVTFDCNQYIKTFDKSKPSNELSETIKESLMTIKQKPVAIANPSPTTSVSKKKIGDMSIITKKSPEKATSKKSPTKIKTSKTSPQKSKKSPTKARKK